MALSMALSANCVDRCYLWGKGRGRGLSFRSMGRCRLLSLMGFLVLVSLVFFVRRFSVRVRSMLILVLRIGLLFGGRLIMVLILLMLMLLSFM